MPFERLQKILARTGIASRRNAERLILEGRIKVNGKIVNELGAKADPQKDHIKVDGHLILPGRFVHKYYICYKPRRMITTLDDPQKRPSIGDLLKDRRIKHRVYPVGRLDWDAEGLLILTSDGELANRIMHPNTHLSKVYVIQVIGNPDKKALDRLRKGVFLEPGLKTLPAQIVILGQAAKKTALKVTLYEGRKNQIKRMFERVGHRVTSIRRIAVGPLNLSGMKPGDIRLLTGDEIRKLKKSSGADDN